MAVAAKPNILVIWGDDIGITNLSCYSDGLMGYRTRTSTGSRPRDAVHRLLRRAELHGGPGLVPFLETFQKFPPRQRAASFTIDQALEKMEAAITAHR